VGSGYRTRRLLTKTPPRRSFVGFAAAITHGPPFVRFLYDSAIAGILPSELPIFSAPAWRFVARLGGLSQLDRFE
jgi:hypothetical protein